VAYERNSGSDVAAKPRVWTPQTMRAVEPTPRVPRPRSSIAAMLLVCGLAGVLLYVAHAAFVPIALALLFALLLSGPVEALHRRRFPRSLSALLILMVFVSLFAGAVSLLWTPAQSWLQAAPRTAQVIQRKMRPLAGLLQRVDALSSRAGHLTDANAPNPAPVPVARPAEAPVALEVVVQTREILIDVITVVILTLSLLAAGPPVLARMSAAFARDAHALHVLQVLESVRGELARYYATIALINLGLGTATFAAMTVLGMPNPLLWGVMAGILNFIPYVGSATTFAVLGIVAFVSFDSIAQVLAVVGSYLAIATFEGQVVQPYFVGHQLELNPIIVFVALWFGGWFWGIPGIALAIPTLVALKVVAEHSPGGAPVLEFLSRSKGKSLRTLRAPTR
jgi:predicted PurR-regulated permease PerM